MIDSHCHLDLDDFNQDREDVLQRCLDKGIDRIIIPATQASSWRNIMSLCQAHPTLHYALGLHPWWIEQASLADLTTLDELLASRPQGLVAVGETGLDFSLENSDGFEKQREFFAAQADLAQTHSYPLVVHHRKSHNQIIRILKQKQLSCGGVIHAFSGSYQQAKQYLDMGFKLGIGGTITYSRAVKTRDAVQRIPLESILLETDAPDMPMAGRQGRRNSPEFLDEVVASLAEIRTESKQQIEQQTTDNAVYLFGLT